jgi:HNH endonuclease
MADAVSAEIRLVVSNRADSLCEYCLIAEEDTFFGCHVDHIVSKKHRGTTTVDNLAYACAFCNRFKGSDIASVNETGELVRFFNPRIDRWSDHFRLEEFRIQSLTDIGEVTARILRFNDNERLLEREELNKVSRYPSAAALIRLEVPGR